MVSSGNFGTWNVLADYSSGTTFSNGNCTTALSQQNSYRAVLGPAIPDSGKWYIEFYIDNQSAGFPSLVGLLDGTINSSLSSGNYLSNAGSFHIEPMNGKLYSESTTGTSYTGNSGSPASIGNSDAKVAIAIDRDANKLWFAVNNTWINVGSGVGDPANGNYPAVSSLEQNLSISHGIRQATGTSKVVINCGQDSTFGGLATAGGNADDNGFGDFFYAPPSGFLALSSANLPISSDIDPAQTNDNFPQKQFNTVLYTGNGSTQSITGLGFQPDAVWIKKRSADQVHQLYDSSRGVTKQIYPSQSGAEATYSTTVTSLDSDGFTLGSGDPNNSSATYVAWCWRANGGTTASNSDGSITTTVQANTSAGFSIMTYTGTGSNATIGHGLSSAPDFVLVKRRSSSQNWAVYHSALGGTYNLVLNENSAKSTGSTFWQDTDTSSSVITIGTEGRVNQSGGTYLAYAWHNVEGYSNFGKFEGNSSTDGPFVYTGFRPRLVFCKSADAAENWQVRDTARSSFNASAQVRIYWNSTSAEGSASTASPIDFLSNGFKVRGSNSEINSSTIVYGAWGDVPFRYPNTF